MLNIRVPDSENQLKPRITVVGVGGAGCNAVNNMIESDLTGVEFLVANTDAQALDGSRAETRLQLGLNITQGLGAGARPDVGRAAAEEAMNDIVKHLEGAHMVFITAGMGGGTGSGAGPVIARAAREMGILTVGVVTRPFHFEGAHRMRIADAALDEMQQYVDTLIVIPNQNLFRIANEKTTFAEAFSMADEVLHSGVRGVTDLMVMPGLINLDFADIRTVMSEMGKAMMGTGEATGERRAIDAAEAAISNPLLDEVSLKGARAMLINITGGMDISLFEVDEAVNHVRDQVDPDANIIFGSTFNGDMEGTIRVSVVATGIDSEEAQKTKSGQGFSATQATSSSAAGNNWQQSRQADAPPLFAAQGYTPPPSVGYPSGKTQQRSLFTSRTPSEPLQPNTEKPAAQTTPTVEEAAPPENEPVLRAQRAFPTPPPLPPQQPEPQAAANPAVDKRTSTTGGLFDRVTGRVSSGLSPQGQANPAQTQQTGLQRGQTQTAVQQMPQHNIETETHPKTTPIEEDIIDIPAFLRRQAN